MLQADKERRVSQQLLSHKPRSFGMVKWVQNTIGTNKGCTDVEAPENLLLQVF